MNYLKDPLLKSKEILLNGEVLNLYSALVKKEDFGNKRSLNSMPYLTGKIVDKIIPLISEEIINQLEYYMQQNIPYKTVKSWVKNKKIPFPLLRVFSLMNKESFKKLSEYIRLIDYITTNSKANYLRLPVFFIDLFSDDILYFYGYLLGDGCISKERLIKLCDGHPNPIYTKYSFKFLMSTKKYIKNRFNLPSKLTKMDNKYELVLTSKYLCRFFKFFYNFKKDKGIVMKPKIIDNNKEKCCVFYRGIFDADAGINVKSNSLVFKSVDKKFIQLCKRDFENYGIYTNKISLDNNVYCLRIYSHNLYDYAKSIGFNHPRKKKILINHLKKGCLIRKFDSINQRNLVNNRYYNLSRISELRIKGISFIFKKYRKQIGTQQYVANLLDTSRENIKRWENDIDSTPFDYHLRLMKLNGFSLIDILEDLSKRNVLFGKGRLKQFTRLPIIFDDLHSDLFRYLNPGLNKTTIKSYGINDRDLNKKDLFNKIKEFFGIKISKSFHSNFIFSILVSNFLNTFYNYTASFDPLSKKEIDKLNEKWNIY